MGAFDWLETADEFVGGDAMDPQYIEEFLKTIDCYVMGSRTYETALRFERKVRVGLWRQAHLRPHESRSLTDPGVRRVPLRPSCAVRQ